MITKKRKKKKKEKEPRDSTRTIAITPPGTEISTLREIIVTFPHPRLFSNDSCCLGVDVKSSSLLLWGLAATPHWGSCSYSSLAAHGVRFSPYPELALHLAYHLARLESFSLASQWALRSRTLSQSMPRLAGLGPLVGKA